MIGNHFKLAWRNLVRDPSQSIINVSGLTLGLVAFIFILQYISLEKSVNLFHHNLDQVYRLINEDLKGNTWTEIEPGYGPTAKERIPEIIDYCRFEQGICKGVVLNNKTNTSFKEENIGYADGNFFEFFSFKVLTGDKAALKRPDVMFLSRSSAIRYFGTLDPVGQSLSLFNQFGNKTFTIGGVYQDIGDESDIQYDMVFSLQSLQNPDQLNGNDWARLDNYDSQYINTFFRLRSGASAQRVEAKLTDLRNTLNDDKDGVIFRLQPLKEVHLASTLADTYTHTAQLKYLLMMGAIALLILLIAWFNYINFSTAKALQRAGEVGVRKVIGATRANLVAQFLSEAILTNLISFIAAIILVVMIQPLFNNLIGKNLSLSGMMYQSGWLTGLLLIILGSFISGAYTAFILSGFNPITTIKGKLLKGQTRGLLRKILVVAQFAISIMLIIATLAIVYQLNYMQKKDLGFAHEQLVVIPGPQVGKDSTYSFRQEGYLNTIAQQSFVKDYCNSGSVPGKFYNFQTSGFTQPQSKPGDEFTSYAFAIIGEKYLPAYEIPIVAGRNFTAAECKVEWNDNSKVILNESAIKKLGFNTPQEAVATRIRWDERFLDIIGVVKDYNHLSVQRPIDPMIFYPESSTAYTTIRITPDQFKDKISGLQKIYQSYFPGNPFEYYFIDENFEKAYASERQFATIFMIASGWAIFIACLGLFGLATYSIQSRTKEIGIRKVLGAGVGSILSLISKEFVILILIAIVIASPIAYFGVDHWLQEFAYRIKLEWWLFALAGGLVLSTALLIIGARALQAALNNPVKALRTE